MNIVYFFSQTSFYFCIFFASLIIYRKEIIDVILNEVEGNDFEDGDETEEIKEEEIKREEIKYENKYLEKYNKISNNELLENDKTYQTDFLKNLKNNYIIEQTPLGNVAMCFNIDKDSFVYYSDSTIPYRFLETIARKYVIVHNCKQIFINMDQELEKYQKRKENESKKEVEHENTSVNVISNSSKKSSSVFANFKSYNTDSKTPSMAPPPKNSIPNKKLNVDSSKVILKESSNRYTCEGRFSNFNILQKVDKKIINQNYNLTFKDFKKMMEDEKEKN